jgi:glycosyltransferase involved in cell wall biosynthesis
VRINLIGQIYGCLGIPNHTRDLFDAIIEKAGSTCDTRVYPLSRGDIPYGLSAALRDRIKPPSDFNNVEGLSIIFWGPDVYPQIVSKINRSKSVICGYLVFEWTKLSDSFVNNCALMDYLLVPSTHARDVLIAHNIPADKIIIVRAGLSKPYRDLSDDSTVDLGTLRLLMVGKWEERKGYVETLDTLLRYFDKTRNSNVSVTLAIDDPFTPNFSLDARLSELIFRDSLDLRIRRITKVEDYADRFGQSTFYIHKRGVLRDEIDMIALYSTHHFIVVPSKAGGVELPLIEAQACGCVPIGMKVSGMADYYTSAGIEIPSAGKQEIRDNKWFRYPTDYGTWDIMDQTKFMETILLIRKMETSSWKELSKRARVEINNICNYEVIVTNFFRRLEINENARGSQSRLGTLPKVCTK